MISERARLVSWTYFVSDMIATAVAFVAAHSLRNIAASTAWLGYLYPLGDYLGLFSFILPSWALVFYFGGMYGRRSSRTLHTEFSRLLRAMIACGLLLSVAIVAAKLDYVSRPFIIIFLLLNMLLLAAGRGLVRAAVLDSSVRRRVLVAGGQMEVQQAAASVDAHRDWGLEVVGVASDGTWGASEAGRYRFLGSYQDIPRLVQRHGDHSVHGGHEGQSDHGVIDEVLVAPATRRLDDLRTLEHIFLGLEEQGIVMRLLVNFLPQSLSEVSFDEVGGMPMLTFSTAPRDELLLFVRRCADVLLALLLLVVLSPVFAIVALLVKLTSHGPVLFRQPRCGLHGRPFTFLKFRSMQVDAEERKPALAPFNEMDGPAFKMTNDPRVTPIGRFLRRTSLDELPQLWNILKGDMSFVGPRPAVIEEVRQYEPWQRRRLSMKPGLTCLWQVSGRNELTFEEWMRLDLEYIDNWSLWLDIKIALKTIPAVLRGRGAR
jgi:exopolysaccharide biosynthesis polyprenyl glycosylphosphotransferase